jgi:hypothetical protein
MTFTEQLGHGANDDRTGLESELRFQRWRLWDFTMPGALPQARNE